jgi:heme/copper-type cytochrome/quinol oxidase subunit 4
MAVLVTLALAAVGLMLLFILAIFDTDDVWLVLATVVSIALIAVVVGVSVWRLIGTDGEKPET